MELATLKAVLFVTAISQNGVSPATDLGAIVNMDVCQDLAIILNDGPQPPGKHIVFNCREHTPPPKKIQVKEHSMETHYTLIMPDGKKTEHSCDIPEEPGYHALAKIIRPLIGKGRDFERVNVFHEGKYTDMFVDDEGVQAGLPHNPVATAIYQNNVLTHDPKAKAEDQPHIYGPAVLFNRRVWF